MNPTPHWRSNSRTLFTQSALSLLGLLLTLSLLGLGSCTFIGVDQPVARQRIDFGPSQTVKVCVMLDTGVSRSDADALLSAWDSEAAKYELTLRAVSYQDLPRAGFIHSQIMGSLDQYRLAPACDRMIYFVGRNVADYGYGLASVSVGLPEILGEVDDQTLTRGFVVAEFGSPSQLLMTPSRVARHELYHLLGCYQHFNMTDCYQRIRDLKAVEMRLMAEGYYATVGEEPFYPTYADHSDAMLISRAQVNRYKGLAPEPVLIEAKIH